MTFLKIANGTVYDPANGTDGIVQGIWVQDGKIITRAGPARILGLKNKGRLGPGADITIYTPGADKKAMFELPRLVIKAGEVVVEQGEIRQDLYGRTLHVAPGYDEGILPDIWEWFEAYYTIQFANYPVDAAYLPHGGCEVECR